MKRLLPFLLVLVSLLTPDHLISQQIATTKDGKQVLLKDDGTWEYLESTAKKESVTQTVYVTNTGTKYHRAGCRYLSKSSIPISLEAASNRYGPCSVCSPPRLQGTTIKQSRTTPQKIISSQCAATTQKGTRCKRKASPGSSYCWQHGG